MATWTLFPWRGEYPFDADAVAAQWDRLHRCDAEPRPQDPRLLQAWALFHAGEFERAAQAGEALGPAGFTVACKALCIQANHVERRERNRLAMFEAAAETARRMTEAQPEHAGAWFWHGYALGRYSQGISVAKALAQGLGQRVRQSLERAVALQPRHADAHVALGLFHAEVIDKVGPLIAGMTYGARREDALAAFEQGLQLNPHSPIALIEYAHGLLMLEGEPAQARADALMQQAAAMKPADAAERLSVELARMELVT